MERRKFRLKILGTYGNITSFCDDIGYSRVQVSSIITGRAVGSLSFWNLAQQKLNLSDGEVWRFINNAVNAKNGTEII